MKNISPSKFAHLHLHTEGSLLDAITKPKDAVKKAANFGHSAIAVTNHGNLFDCIPLAKEAKKVGIKPIFGVEVYLTDDIIEDKKNKIRSFTHLTLLAKNDEGWVNLKKLVTISNKIGFYYKPRIDLRTIQELNEGLICLSGCMSSKLSKLILENEKKQAMEWANQLKETFPNSFFLEVMDGGIDEEEIIRQASRDIASKLGLETVATQDSHYLHQCDWDVHEVACALSNNSRLDDPTYSEGGRRKRFSTNEFWLKDIGEMSKKLTPRELQMSYEIAEMCEAPTQISKKRIPSYSKDALEQLNSICNKSLQERGLASNTKYTERLSKEVKDIADADLADYFMIVKDIVDWTKGQDIPVGPGRGSAVGSIVSYLMDITEIDPLEHGLIWERFYNRGRKGSMPDIDTDVCQARRNEVIDYISNKFGEDNVAHIMSLGKFGLRASIRDVGRCMGLSLREIEKVTKLIPAKGMKTIEEVESRIPQVAKLFEKYPDLSKISRRMMGVKRHISTHASAIVVLDEGFTTGSVPMSYNAKEKQMMTGFDMYDLDDLGYLKLDILGLKTATLIGECEKDLIAQCTKQE